MSDNDVDRVEVMKLKLREIEGNSTTTEYRTVLYGFQLLIVPYNSHLLQYLFFLWAFSLHQLIQCMIPFISKCIDFKKHKTHISFYIIISKLHTKSMTKRTTTAATTTNYFNRCF